MPTPVIGGQYDAPVPDVAEQIALGRTHVRIYWATSETAAATLVSTQALAAGTFVYSYNKTDAAATDWAEHCLYDATNGEGPRSERVPIAPSQPRATRKVIRQGVGKRLRLLKVVSVTSSAAATEFISNELIDPDASERLYANRFARVTSGTYADAIRRVRDFSTTADNKGYTASSGRIIVGRSFGGTLTAADEVELWRPKGDEDPSEMIDQATNDARHSVWWEEDIYIVTESGVTDYALPGYVAMETQVKGVWYAAGDYPDEPQWVPVGRAEPRRLGGQVWLTNVEQDALSRQQYPANSVLKVMVNRSGDLLQSDTDAWDGCPSLEWAIAEAAYEFLLTLGSPSGGFEDVMDVDRALQKHERLIQKYRAMFLPSPAVRVELAK